MHSVKNAGHYVKDKSKSGNSALSKESNKQIAKDPNVGVTTRARAAGNALLDRMDQSQHKTNASIHKEAAKH